MQEQNPDTVLEQQTAASEPEDQVQEPAADIQQPAQAAAPAKEEAPAQPAEPAAVTVVDIRFRNNAKSYYFDPAGLTLQAGAHVIIDTARGDEFGLCAAGNHPVKPRELVLPLRRVLRVATQQDERANAENQEKEKKAFEICQKVFAYTNHTVMAEALDKWNVDIFKMTLPRIYQIVVEMNRRAREELEKAFPGD